MGESATGKELIANTLMFLANAQKGLHRQNCGALSWNWSIVKLILAMLKGAFTEAP